jgi:ankyrin repeat protein
LHSAVVCRNEVSVRDLIRECEVGNIDSSIIDEEDEDGFTPLHYACILRCHGIIDALHAANVDVTIKDRYGFTPIHWAALQLDDYTLSLLTSHVFNIGIYSFIYIYIIIYLFIYLLLLTIFN